MKKTIFITGASSGIGRAAAELFAAKGWQVAATMRHPEKEHSLQNFENVRLFRLDVTRPETIAGALEGALQAFGDVDVLVNNAGYGAVGIFEKAEPEQIQKQFDTNVFGLMNVTRAFLPHFRKRKAGTIVNISSVGGRITFPVYSVYHATKWAVEGFSESLQFELRPFNIRVRLVEPAAIKTDFYSRSKDVFQKEGFSAYDAYEKVTLANAGKFGEEAPGPEVVAKTIWKAATRRSQKMRYASSVQGKMLLFMRKVLPLSWFLFLIRSQVEKGFSPAG
ncbi:MAG TPA: SDR family oxidoreductase [Bacteroidetes bacterium]|nr:SDR family oxidoreductase [Bacteroidota bacterium]